MWRKIYCCNNNMFRLRDEFCSTIFHYRTFHNFRSIPMRLIACNSLLRPSSPPTSIKKVLYGDQDLDPFYCSAAEIVDATLVLLQSLSCGFDYIVYRPHPATSFEHKKLIQSHVLSSIQNIVVDTSCSLSLSIVTHNPSHIASFMSASCLNVDTSYIQPMFLYNFLPPLYSSSIPEKLYRLLDSWNYNHIFSLNQLSFSYSSNLSLFLMKTCLNSLTCYKSCCIVKFF